MNGVAPAEYRRLAGVHEVGPYDTVYVAAREEDAAVSCAGRLLWERGRGLRALIVTVFDAADGPSLDADHLALGLPGPGNRDAQYEPWRPSTVGPEDLRSIARATALLEEVLRRAKPRHLYLPLGVGGLWDRGIAHEAALATVHPAEGRDVFLYEERPEALVSGSVRIRLGEMGARLPPAASRVVGEGGLTRFLLRSHSVPRLRGGVKGIGRRLRYTRLAAQRWLGARAWRPQKALGPRLQPVVHVADPSRVEATRGLVRAVAARFGSKRAERVLKFATDQARRLGGRGHVERYWLLLPSREDEARAVVPPAWTAPVR